MMQIKKSKQFNIIFNIKRRVVSYEEGKHIKERNRLNLFMETSAKSGFNVMKLFCDSAKILYEESMQKKEVNKVRYN